MTLTEQKKMLYVIRLLLETHDLTPIGARELMRVLDIDEDAA